MKHLLRCLERYGIGSRAWTEDDFWNACSLTDTEVVWSKSRFPFCFTVPDEDIRCIVLPRSFTGPQLLFAMAHEFAHIALHGGDDPCIAFQGYSDAKYEAEANAAALIALIPKQVLLSAADHSRCRSPYLRKLWHDRERLYIIYGI